MDEFLFYHLDILSNTTLDISNRSFDQNENVNALPDGVYRIKEANNYKLEYDVRVNDHHIWQYHRENGFTKIGIYYKEKGITAAIHRVMEGQIEAASLINKAYIKQNFEKVTVITGINIYPFKLNLK